MQIMARADQVSRRGWRGRSRRLRLASNVPRRRFSLQDTLSQAALPRRSTLSASDAVSRFSIKASGGDPYPARELRARFRAKVVDHCGPMDVDMTSGGKGPVLVSSPIGFCRTAAVRAIVAVPPCGSCLHGVGPDSQVRPGRLVGGARLPAPCATA